MKIAAANPLWGAPRIHGELGKLGIEVSERTVSRLVRRPRRPPSQTWRTFLTNHVAALGSIDFFTVPTVTGRVLFVFVVLLHHRRRIVHFNVTEHPTAAWTAQQVVEAFPDDTAPRWLLRDRDAIYGEAFRQRVAGMGRQQRRAAFWRRTGCQTPGRSAGRSVDSPTSVPPFISTTAAITSRLGPFGPSFFGTLDEKSRLYFLVVSARWRLKSVEGLNTIAQRINGGVDR